MSKFVSSVLLLFFVTAIAGPLEASEKSLNQHYHKHIVTARPDSSTNGVLKDIRLKHEESDDEEELYLRVSGTIGEPWDRSRSRAFITASFLDGEGNIVIEESTEVLIGSSSSRNKQQRFSLRIEDDPSIVQCVVKVEWAA